MTVDEDMLGTCLECETPLLEEQHVLTYESEGTVAVLAECPRCRELTYPG